MDKAVESVEKSPPLRSFSPKARYGLGIFAKEPLPGKVKTRLCPPLSAESAASLYRASLEETVASAAEGPWETVLFYSGSRPFFEANFPRIPLRPQRGADLGARMKDALRTLLRDFEAAVLIGSDSPDLPPRLIRAAFAALGDHDAVVSPANDGGYVLIGERTHHPALFRGIPWSTPEVLCRTRERARANAVSLAEIAPWDDFDDVPSLLRLLERSPESRTAHFVRENLQQHVDMTPTTNP